MRTLFVLCCACFAIPLAGCSGIVPPSRLEPPAKVLMKSPEPLPEVKTGEDIVKSHVALRRQYATETDKLTRLQVYVRTVTRK